MPEILVTLIEVIAAFGIVFLFTMKKQDDDDHDDGKMQRVRVPVNSQNHRGYRR